MRRLAALAVALLLLCTGCSLIDAELRTADLLELEGFRNASVDSEIAGGLVSVTVSYDSAAPGKTPNDAARVVWTTLEIRVDRMAVRPGAGGGLLLDRDAMVEAFGPRDPALDTRDAKEIEATFVRVGVSVIAGVLIGIVLVVILVVVLVRRSRRRNAQLPGWGQPQYGWSPYAPPQQAWPPPPPPGWPAAPSSWPNVDPNADPHADPWRPPEGPQRR